MANFSSIEQLLGALKSGRRGDPKFVLLLGAGASASSGIPTGGRLIEQWREQFDQAAEPGNLAANQEWYGETTEYGSLFEHYHRTPALRQAFVESCVDGAQPSWGYLYLADLLDKGYFNVVLTTNFDDLVNEACHAFTSSLRPLVCAHDSSIHLFRLTGKRPKVIKLHGDYLYENIKNTPGEVLNLEENTRTKIEWLAAEYGLVSIGYSGGDESVMSVIAERLQKDHAAFPNGLFWCVSNKDNIPARLKPHASDDRVSFVECRDFDVLMARVHEHLVGEPAAIVSSFPKVMAERMSHLISGLGLPNSSGEGNALIERDVKILAASIPHDGNTTGPNIALHLPVGFLGFCHFQKERYSTAAGFFRKEIIDGPQTSVTILTLFFECLRHDWDQQAFDDVCEKIKATFHFPENRFEWLCSAVVSMIHGQQFDAAIHLCDLSDEAFAMVPVRDAPYAAFARINRAQITLHRGGQLDDKQTEEITTIFDSTENVTTRFGCLIVLDRSKEAGDLLISHREEFPKSLADWPIVELMSTPQRNIVRKLFTEGVKHYHNLNVEFQLGLQDVPPSGPKGRSNDENER